MTIGNQGINILMVTPRYYPYMGGTETHVHEVGSRLVNKGATVTLLTTMPHKLPTPLPKQEIIEGMHVIRVQAWPPQRDYYIAPEMYSIIAHGKWDIVHCQGCHTFVPLVAMFASRKANIPYLVTFHTGGHSSRIRTSIRSLQWKLQRPFLANASKLIGVSRFEVDYFQNMLGLNAKKFSIIPNGGILPDLKPLTSRPLEHSLIVSVGRLEKYKGHQHLITALPFIREKLLDARLLILGTGPYEANLRELAQKVGVADNVEIRSVPPGERQEMAEILSQAVLVALLSEYESQGIAVMEALAVGCPVLVANTSALQELAEQKFVRSVSLSSTPQEIAAAALCQIENPIVSTELALPTWEDCAQELLALYRSSLQSK